MCGPVTSRHQWSLLCHHLRTLGGPSIHWSSFQITLLSQSELHKQLKCLLCLEHVDYVCMRTASLCASANVDVFVISDNEPQLCFCIEFTDMLTFIDGIFKTTPKGISLIHILHQVKSQWRFRNNKLASLYIFKYTSEWGKKNTVSIMKLL